MSRIHIFKNTCHSLVALIILLLTHLLVADAQSDRVDSCIAAQMAFRHIPGLALAVIRDGVPVKVKGYGLANVELNVPVNPETVFQSGSVGKQFTSMLVMLLVEEQKIDLDESINRYFANAPTSWQNITVRHLLTHTSGIPDFEALSYGKDTMGLNFQEEYTEDQLLAKAMRLPLSFKPGEKWSYSNTGYVLLGILIHKVTGRFYGDLLKERIFTPLAMETARIINEADIIPNRAAGYRLENGDWKNQEWVSPSLNTTADGSLYLTILDLIKWDAALSSGKILGKSSYTQTWSPVRLTNDSLHPYGFGWRLAPVNGHRTVTHDGVWQGFNSFIGRYPDDRITIILLMNLHPSNPRVIGQTIAGLLIPDLVPKSPQRISDKDPQFTTIVERLFSKPDTANIDIKLFSKDYRQKAKAALTANARSIAMFGPVQSVELVGYAEDNNTTTLEYRVRSKVGSRIATIVRIKPGEISSIVSRAE